MCKTTADKCKKTCLWRGSTSMHVLDSAANNLDLDLVYIDTIYDCNAGRHSHALDTDSHLKNS